MVSDPHVHLQLSTGGLRSSATVAMNERSRELARHGREVFKLGFGQSPFPVPEPVVAMLRANAHQKDYLPMRGLAGLRAAVAGFHSRREGLDISADDVLIGPGSKQLLFLVQFVYDCEVIIPSPAWVSYAPQACLIGREVVRLATSAATGWRLQPAVLDDACRRDPDRPRVLILNYPGNPTGTSFGPDALRALAEVARRHRVLVLSDEIYGEFNYRGEHVSIARFYPEGTLITSGLSKWAGAGGWRLGTMVFPPSLRPLLDAVAVAASETYTTASAPIQYAAVRAFEDDVELNQYRHHARTILAALGPWVAERLGAADITCPAPEGGFYLFIDFECHRARLATAGIDTSAALCERLLTDTGVALLPGSDFGRPDQEFTCRLAYVDFDGAAALAAASALGADERPDEAFLRAHCGRVCEAADRIAGWVARL